MADDGDPTSPLAQAATMAHEMVLTLSAPGRFTEAQALYLVGQMLSATPRA